MAYDDLLRMIELWWGACLVDNTGLKDAKILFEKPLMKRVRACGYIYEAMQRLCEQEYSVDLITLTNELKQMEVLDDIGGPSYLVKLIDDYSLEKFRDMVVKAAKEEWQ